MIARIDLDYREAAMGLTLAVLVAIAFVAVPYNFFTVADPDAGLTEQNHLEVRDYTVTYAEDVPDQYISSVGLGAVSHVNASGVIVVSEQREIWWEEVSAGRVAADGGALVRVGGIGWRETVLANRSGWSVAGNHSAYVVYLRHADRRTLAFVSDPSRASPRIAGRNVTVVPGPRFTLRVTHNGSAVGVARMPSVNHTTAAGGLRFVRRGRSVYAVHPVTARVVNGTVVAPAGNLTRVRVAVREKE